MLTSVAADMLHFTLCAAEPNCYGKGESNTVESDTLLAGSSDRSEQVTIQSLTQKGVS